MTDFRPRRSALYIPGSNKRALEKARGLAADVVILDLEDAVAPQGKIEARDNIAEAFAAGFGDREVVIRVNSLDTPWGEGDLAFCATVNPDAVLVPKVGSAGTVMALARGLEKLGIAERTRVWAMVETPLAILNVATIASVAQDPASRLSCLVMGTNDLLKDSRMRAVAGRANLVPWLSMAVAAARAYSLTVLDGVFNAFDDAEGFAAECRQGADFGFDGKTVIHPSQISPANEIFAPGAEEVSRARAILEAFALPENAEAGVLSLNGQMVERLHAEIARQTVVIAEAIERKQNS